MKDSAAKHEIKSFSPPEICHSLPFSRESAFSSDSTAKGIEIEGSGYNQNHPAHSCGFNRVEQNIETGRKENSPSNPCCGSVNKSINSPSKVNGNSTGTGVLRYALHLRFLCPWPKKKSMLRCKSDPLSTPAKDNRSGEDDHDRRFYLYSDMRVVFPQRHSDSDEGKVPNQAKLLAIIMVFIYPQYFPLHETIFHPWC